MGKLFVIEGLDGSGKATQTALLCQYLETKNKPYKKITFPDYAHPSSEPVKLYLSGALGSLSEINAYAASSFFSVDRYASYRQFWRQDYQDGVIIIADRYTTSNASHQTSKMPKDQWDSYLDWLQDFEYSKLGLPRPSSVIFLDMHPDTSQCLLKKRYGGDETKKDIHEADLAYLLRCRESALYTAQKMGWHILRCCDGQSPFPKEDIAAKIAQIIEEALAK